MSDDTFSLPTPAFKAEEALVQLRRALRELKLAERGNAYELRGKRIAELALDDGAIAVKLARRRMSATHPSTASSSAAPGTTWLTRPSS